MRGAVAARTPDQATSLTESLNFLTTYVVRFGFDEQVSAVAGRDTLQLPILPVLRILAISSAFLGC
jgi:hypothetical protein